MLEIYPQPLTLEDRSPHTLQWTRDTDGYMQVNVDGQEVLRVADRGLSGNFDGLLIVNRGGNYGIKSVRVLSE